MAGDWIKFEKSTPDKPEVWKIAADLGIDPDAVVGKLLRVWSWFDAQSEDGNADSVSKMLLDRSVGVNGFCDSMIKAGWMQDDGEVMSLPNFDNHNGKTAKTRALTAKRVASHKAKSNVNGNGNGVSSALPREEKRREENKPHTSPAKPDDAAIGKAKAIQIMELFNQVKQDHGTNWLGISDPGNTSKVRYDAAIGRAKFVQKRLKRQEKPDDWDSILAWFGRLYERWAQDNFYSGGPTAKYPEGYKRSFESLHAEKAFIEALDRMVEQ